MGLFTKNTLTVDETIDVVTYIAVSSLAHYMLRGDLLQDNQRAQMCERRMELRGKKASTWHKSKLCIAGDSIARQVLGNAFLLEAVEGAYRSEDQEAKDEINNEIAILARAYVVQNKLV